MMAGSETSTGLEDESESVIICSNDWAVFRGGCKNLIHLETRGILAQWCENNESGLLPEPIAAVKNTRGLGTEIRVKQCLKSDFFAIAIRHG